MKSKAFILVCNENIKTLENGRIDPSYHYELSTEIDAFYALTQLDGGVNVSDSKVLVCGDYNQKRLKGQETLLHELFATFIGGTQEGVSPIGIGEPPRQRR